MSSGPVPISRVWSGAKVLAEDLQGEDLADVLQLHARSDAWWVLPQDDADDPSGSDGLDAIADQLGLDELAVNDLRDHNRKTSFDELGDTAVMIMHAVELDTSVLHLHLRSARMVLTDRVLVCLSDGAGQAGSFSPARLLAGAQDRLAETGVEGAAEALVAAVLDSYVKVIEWVEDESDRLSDRLFDHGTPLTKHEQLNLFRLRKVVSKLRRLTVPLGDVLGRLADSRWVSSADQNRRWSKLLERQARIGHGVDALGDTLNSVLQTSLALSDERANAVMRKLTGWAAIIAVPTLVTGFVGMNVLFPLDGTSLGFWVYLVIMAVPVVVLFVIFRRLRWI